MYFSVIIIFHLFLFCWLTDWIFFLPCCVGWGQCVFCNLRRVSCILFPPFSVCMSPLEGDGNWPHHCHLSVCWDPLLADHHRSCWSVGCPQLPVTTWEKLLWWELWALLPHSSNLHPSLGGWECELTCYIHLYFFCIMCSLKVMSVPYQRETKLMSKGYHN